MEREQVVAALKARLNQNSQDLEAATILGNLYFDQNDSAQAIVYYRLALDIDPDQPGVYTDLGTMYWQNENISLAEQAFRRVVDQYPGFGNAYINLGLLLQAKGDTSAARTVWHKLVTDFPADEAVVKARELLQKTLTLAY